VLELRAGSVRLVHVLLQLVTHRIATRVLVVVRVGVVKEQMVGTHCIRYILTTIHRLGGHGQYNSNKVKVIV